MQNTKNQKQHTKPRIKNKQKPRLPKICFQKQHDEKLVVTTYSITTTHLTYTVYTKYIVYAL